VKAAAATKSACAEYCSFSVSEGTETSGMKTKGRSAM